METADMRIAKQPSLQRTTSLTRRLPTISRDIRLFGCLTFFTMLVIIGMSVYVVHNTEVRWSESDDGKLLANDGSTMITGLEEYEVPSLAEVLALSDQKLRRIEDIAVTVAVPSSNDIAHVVMKVDRVMRFGSGLTKLCSPDHACILALPQSNGTVDANYTDEDDCSPPATAGHGCPVLLSAEDVARHGRRLWLWSSDNAHVGGSDASSSCGATKETCCKSQYPSYWCILFLDSCGNDASTCCDFRNECAPWSLCDWMGCGDHHEVYYCNRCGIDNDGNVQAPFL